MKRQKYLPSIPDAINCQAQDDFTKIPNEFLRNPAISAKAKLILCLLLGNKQGWKSFITVLQTFMKEGEDTVRAGIKELERFGYLMRFNYRDKVTKQWKGWLWAYTDIPYSFDLKQSLVLLDLHSLEIPQLEKRLRQKISPVRKKPEVGFPTSGETRTNNTNLNNINNKNIFVDEEISMTASNGYITPKDFFKFCKLYPSHRIGSKGEALTKWEVACRSLHRPTWNRVERALAKQKQSEQWVTENGKYIPLARTWIHQKRWLDDPSQYYSGAKDQESETQHGDSWREKFGFKE